MSIAPMTDQTANVAAPSLRLRLTRNQGMSADGALPMPAAGAGLAGALALADRKPDEEQRREADLCRIGLHGSAWLFSNGSRALVCAVNGERVPAGATAPVADGDVLEIGLLRFVVAVAAGDTDDDAFDLRDLAEPALGLGERSDGWRAEQPFADPFGALDIDGARPQPVADPLAELLGEPPVANARAASPPPETGRRAPPPCADTAGVLLDELHAEFVRAVRDPGRPAAAGAVWESSQEAIAERKAESFEDMSRHALTAFPLVRDVLKKRETIDQIFDGFGSTGESTLLDAEKPDEVLGLFAPELARGVKASLPSITRRDHHALSPDSHLYLPPAASTIKESQ